MLNIKKKYNYHKICQSMIIIQDRNFTKLKYLYLNSKFNSNAENLIHNNVCLYRAIPYPLQA